MLYQGPRDCGKVLNIFIKISQLFKKYISIKMNSNLLFQLNNEVALIKLGLSETTERLTMGDVKGNLFSLLLKVKSDRC